MTARDWGVDPKVRAREPELMDAPGLERNRHLQALDALGRVNRVSLTASRVWREVERLWRSGSRPVRVLDVACGGGDVLIEIARRATRRRVPVQLVGYDVSAVAVERARARAGPHHRGDSGAVATRFEQLDVLAAPLPSGSHLVHCSLFLHHLSAGEATRLLQAMAAACEHILLVQDLRRTSLGYALAWLGLHTLTRSSVARTDGLTSVRSAFQIEEVRDLARHAGLEGAVVSPCWPQRFTLRWARERAGS